MSRLKTKIHSIYLIGLALLAPPSWAAPTLDKTLCAPYQMLTVENRAEATSSPTSFLWSIRKNGIKDSYLLGTFHAGGSRIYKNWETLPLLFPELKSYVAETDFQEKAAREFTALSMNEDAALESLLGPELFTRGLQILSDYGLAAPAAAKMKPWRIFLEMAGQPRQKSSLDAFLGARANANALRIHALQSPPEMVSSIETLAVDEQVQILKETICNYDLVQKQSARLEQLYSEDAVNEFNAEAARLTSPVAGLSQKLENTLVAERNRIFVPRLKPDLDAGRAFVAVGAGHLFGRQGLVQLLREQGYELIPLERRAFAARLISAANQSTVQPLQDLLKFLRTTTLKIPEQYSAPQLRFASSEELESLGCGDDCEMTMTGSAIYLTVADYQAVQAGDPHVLSSLLAHLIRDIQMAQAGKQTCMYWQEKNVESILLRSQFLSRRGTASAGLDSLPMPDCSF